VVLDVKRRLRKLREAEELLKVTEMSREAAREKARITMNQYRQQAVLLKDLLEAQAGLAHANDQYQQALLGLWTAKADFEKALGED
jgi:outer membrane protein TolC